MTTNIWTSDSNKIYVSVTCHFVNEILSISQVLSIISTDEMVGPYIGESIDYIINKISGDWRNKL